MAIDKTLSSTSFIPVTLTPCASASSAIELIHSSGWRLAVDSANTVWLTQLLRELTRC